MARHLYASAVNSDAATGPDRSIRKLWEAAQVWRAALLDDGGALGELDGATAALELLGAELAVCPADCLEDIAMKAQVWKILAPEDALSEDHQTVDEALIASLVADIERLGAVRA